MQKISKSVSQTVQLADRLLEDIKRRNLSPGDPYFTTLDARRFLGVGGTIANRALQLLEKRQVIKRTQGRGAVILPPPVVAPGTIARLHILLPELYFRTEGFGSDGILFGVQSEMPSAYVSQCLLMPQGGTERIESLINRAIGSGGTDAFILASVPFETQRAVARTGFPAVVFGTAYRGAGDLPQLERDLGGGVRLMIDHFRSRGCRKIATLLRQHIQPGDHEIFDVVLSTLGIGSPLRFLAQEKDHMIAEVRNILRTDPDVDAFLCQSTVHAEAVREALEREGRPADEMSIGVLFSYVKRNTPNPFTHIQMVPAPEEVGRELATMLRNSFRGKQPANRVIPIELVEAGSSIDS